MTGLSAGPLKHDTLLEPALNIRVLLYVVDDTRPIYSADVGPDWVNGG